MQQEPESSPRASILQLQEEPISPTLTVCSFRSRLAAGSDHRLDRRGGSPHRGARALLRAVVRQAYGSGRAGMALRPGRGDDPSAVRGLAADVDARRRSRRRKEGRPRLSRDRRLCRQPGAKHSRDRGGGSSPTGSSRSQARSPYLFHLAARGGTDYVALPMEFPPARRTSCV